MRWERRSMALNISRRRQRINDGFDGLFLRLCPTCGNGRCGLTERDEPAELRGERGFSACRRDDRLRPIQQNRPVLEKGVALSQLRGADELAPVCEDFATDGKREAGRWMRSEEQIGRASCRERV